MMSVGCYDDTLASVRLLSENRATRKAGPYFNPGWRPGKTDMQRRVSQAVVQLRHEEIEFERKKRQRRLERQEQYMAELRAGRTVA